MSLLSSFMDLEEVSVPDLIITYEVLSATIFQLSFDYF